MAIIICCEECDKKLKVPDGSEGKRFRCTACKAVITVPDAEEEEEDDAEYEDDVEEEEEEEDDEDEEEDEYEEEDDGEDDRPSRGAAARKRKSPSRRPSGPKKTRGDRKTGLRRRPGGTEPDEDGKKKSPLLLIVGIAAGVVLLLGIVGFALVGGGGDDKPAPDDPDASTEEDPAEAAEEEAEKKNEALEAYRALVDSANSPRAWLDAGKAARQIGRLNAADRHFLTALSLDPEFEPAYSALGWRKYKIPETARDLLSTPGLIDALARYDDQWLDPRKYEEVVSAEASFLSEAQRIYDEKYAALEGVDLKKIEEVFRTAKGYGDRVWGSRIVMPYYVFDERGMKGEELMSPEDSEFLVNKKLRMLQKLYAFMRERWWDRLGFERDEKRPLVAAVFQNGGTFQQFNNAIGTYLPPGALAYFSRQTKYIYLYDSQASSPEDQDHQDGILFHEGTHQIVDAYLSSGSGMGRVSYWFNEGIAEYVGSVKRKYDDEGEPFWEFGADNPGRIREFWRARRPDLNSGLERMGVKTSYAFTLSEILRCKFPMQAMNFVRKKIPASAWPAIENNGTAGSLIYAQASFLLYFAYTCGKPEYAEAMDRYLKKEFTGQGSKKAFMEAFGLDSDEALNALEKEYLDYHESLVPDIYKKKR